MKRIVALLSVALFLSNFQPVYAEKVCDQCDRTKSQGTAAEVKSVENLGATIKKALPEAAWSASEEQIEKAPCRRRGAHSLTEIESWMINYESQTSEKVSANFFGIKIEDDNKLLVHLFGQLLTAIEDDFDMGFQHRWKNPRWNKRCKKVMCAVENIFGKIEGPKLLFMLARYGFNGSQYSKPMTRAWKPFEIDNLLMALSDFPDSVLPLEKNRPLVRVINSRNSGAGRIIANAVINVFDDFDALSTPYQQVTIFHEMGHNFAFNLRLGYSEDWRRFSGWTKGTEIRKGQEVSSIQLTKPETCTSVYAMTDPGEDFAEAVVAYRYNPQELKQRSAEKYQFIKEIVFDGLEYTSPEKCDPKQSYSSRLMSFKKQNADRLSENPGFLRDINNVCAPHLLNGIPGEKPQHEIVLEQRELKTCLSEALPFAGFSDVLLESGVSIKYPEYVRSALKLRNFESEAPEKVEKFFTASQQRIKKSLIKIMSDMEAKRASFYRSYRNDTPEKYCEGVRNGVSWDFRNLVSVDLDEENSYKPFGADKMAAVDFIVRKTCLRVLGGQKPVKPMTKAELTKAIDQEWRIP